MINSVKYTQEVAVNYNLNGAQNKVTNSQSSRRTTSNQDIYVSDNPVQNLKNGLKSGDVQYVEPTTILWGAITIRDEYYTYKCNGHESIGDIKKKFGIPDNVIFDLNRIKDDDYCPETGKEIAFRYKK